MLKNLKLNNQQITNILDPKSVLVLLKAFLLSHKKALFIAINFMCPLSSIGTPSEKRPPFPWALLSARTSFFKWLAK